MASRVFVGFGLGAIQSGLFLHEAYSAGNFDRLIASEVNPEVVAAIRKSGRCTVNVATPTGIEVHTIEGVEVYNPLEPSDRSQLVQAVGQANELSTALPSVDFYDKGDASVAKILAEGLSLKLSDSRLPDAVIYTAENNNHAAERLHADLSNYIVGQADRLAERVQILNTVIGKMSGVVTERTRMEREGLSPVTDTGTTAFLVEAFNRILISSIKLPGFERGIKVFVEKENLLPFEEAKLYGHNATHALLGYLCTRRGYAYAFEATQDPDLISTIRDAFLLESGGALIHRHRGIDPLFTDEGYTAYADDLLNRMLNPYLHDTAERLTRDPRRKLGWDDRLIGTIRLALEAGIHPGRFISGTQAAVALLEVQEGPLDKGFLTSIWQQQGAGREEAEAIASLIQ